MTPAPMSRLASSLEWPVLAASPAGHPACKVFGASGGADGVDRL